MFEYFGSRVLKELLGKDLLKKIEEVLPALDKDLDELAIHRRRVLAKIFASFTDADTFKKKGFRTDFYKRIPVEKLDSILEQINPSLVNSPYNNKLKYLVDLKWVNSNESNIILNELNLSDSLLPGEEIKRNEIELIPKNSNPYKTLKDYQSKIYYESLTELNDFNRFIIQMPTGSGKTRTSMEIITSLLKEDDDNSIIIWLAHSTELLEQSVASFKEVWSHVGNKDVQIGRVFSEYNALDNLPDESCFIVAGFQKLHSIFKSDNNAFDEFLDRIKLIIVDEAHKVLAPTYKELTTKLTYSNGCLIGLTATPGRSSNDIFENKKLAEYFFNKKLSINTGSDQSVIQYLKDRNVLAHAKFDSLITSVKITLTPLQLNYLENRFDYPPGFLKDLGNNQIRNIEILKKLLAYLEEGKQTLFFGTSVDQSKFINSILIYFGFSSCHIDGSTNKNTREKNIQLFKENKLQVICNYGVLTTGFDAPKTDLIFIARPTQSIVLYSQMIGRGLRGPAIGGTEKCIICTVKDNIEGLPDEDKIYDYFDEYFD